MDDLQQRARDAYERGRLHEALPWGLVALVMGLVGSTLGSPWSILVGLLTGGLAVWMRIAGLDLGLAAADGFRAGVGPWFAVVAWTAALGGCAACASQCVLVCGTAGVAVAAVLFRQSRGASYTRRVGAAVIASLLCATACVGFGLVGVATASLVVAATIPLRVLVDGLA